MSALDDEIDRIKHNLKCLENLKKFVETEKLYDEGGKELDLGYTVSFKMPHNGSYKIPTLDQLRNKIEKCIKDVK